MSLLIKKLNKQTRILSRVNLVNAIVNTILELFVLVSSLYFGFSGNFWFDAGQYFTNQSNWLVLIFLVCFLINKKKRFMKTNSFLIVTTVYIMITCIIYNAILLPTYGFPIEKLNLTYSIFAHIICPILMLALLLCRLFMFDNRDQTKWYKITGCGMIYPTIYLIWMCIQCFLKIGGEYHSTYGKYTNLNPNFELDGTPGSPVWVCLYFGIFCLFGTLISLNWLLDFKMIEKYNSLSKKRSKK